MRRLWAALSFDIQNKRQVASESRPGAPTKEEEMMLGNLLRGGLLTVLLSSGAFAQDQEFASAEEAKAMLERAVAALKNDKTKALAMFNAEEGPFRDRDLYVFCANVSDGIETAHPTHRGWKLPEMKDANGFAFGQKIMETAKDGEISEVAYMWPRPGAETAVQKVTYITKVTDQVCGVGYYE